MDLTVYFASLAALAGLVVVVTELFENFVKNTTWVQVISWVFAIALAFVGQFFQLGIFIGLTWYWTLIYGVAAGLVANGIFDINIVQAILEVLKIRVPKK